MNQDTYTNQEIEIDIKDILAYCFFHWRSALALVLAVGLLYGGYNGVKSYRTYNIINAAFDRYEKAIADGITDPDEIEKAVGNPSVMASIKNKEKADALTAQNDDIRKLIAEKNNYLENAEAMQINPNEEAFTTLSAYVSDVNDANNSLDPILQAYSNNLVSESCKEKIEDKTGIDAAYIKDLIDIEIVSGNSGDKFAVSGMLTIDIIGQETDTTQKIADILKDEMQEMNAEMAAVFGPHSVRFLNTVSGIRQDKDLITMRKELNAEIATYNTQITTNETALNGLSSTGKIEGVRNVVIKGAIKKGLIGAIIVFMLYGLLLCIRYVVSHTPFTRTQFESRYRFMSLGNFSDAKESIYKHSGAFDKWLRKLIGVRDRAENKSKVYDMIAVNISVYAKEAKNIIITGSADMDEKVKLVVELRSRHLDKTFQPAESLVTNAEDRGKLNTADGIIFFEKYGLSKYEDIDAEIALAQNAGVDIIGCVTE